MRPSNREKLKAESYKICWELFSGKDFLLQQRQKVLSAGVITSAIFSAANGAQTMISWWPRSKRRWKHLNIGRHKSTDGIPLEFNLRLSSNNIGISRKESLQP